MKESVPNWGKPYLTIEEAAGFYNIGIHKLRELSNQPDYEMCIL